MTCNDAAAYSSAIVIASHQWKGKSETTWFLICMSVSHPIAKPLQVGNCPSTKPPSGPLLKKNQVIFFQPNSHSFGRCSQPTIFLQGRDQGFHQLLVLPDSRGGFVQDGADVRMPGLVFPELLEVESAKQLNETQTKTGESAVFFWETWKKKISWTSTSLIGQIICPFHQKVGSCKMFTTFSGHNMLDRRSAQASASQMRPYWFPYTQKKNWCNWPVDDKKQVIAVQATKANQLPQLCQGNGFRDVARVDVLQEFPQGVLSWTSSSFLGFGHQAGTRTQAFRGNLTTVTTGPFFTASPLGTESLWKHFGSPLDAWYPPATGHQWFRDWYSPAQIINPHHWMSYSSS